MTTRGQQINWARVSSFSRFAPDYFLPRGIFPRWQKYDCARLICATDCPRGKCLASLAKLSVDISISVSFVLCAGVRVCAWNSACEKKPLQYIPAHEAEWIFISHLPPAKVNIAINVSRDHSHIFRVSPHTRESNDPSCLTIANKINVAFAEWLRVSIASHSLRPLTFHALNDASKLYNLCKWC